MFKKLMTEGIDKAPELYKAEEGDAEGNKLLEAGFNLVDRVFSGGAPIKEGDAPMSPQEMVAAHAEIRNKAAAFDRLAFKTKALRDRVAALEAEVAEYEKSAPAGGAQEGGTQPAPSGDDMESVLGGLDKLGK